MWFLLVPGIEISLAVQCFDGFKIMREFIGKAESDAVSL